MQPRICTIWLLMTILCAAISTTANAMSFQISQGSIYATGEIVAFDSMRFRELVIANSNVLRRNKFGLVEMYLNSKGGKVDEATAISNAMDQIGVATVVPAGSYCASGCASILFLSGRMRNSEGMLGFHSCSKIGDKTSVRSDACNKAIKAFISKRGSSSEAARLLGIFAEPSHVTWINAPTAHCLGFDLYNNGYVRLGSNPCQEAGRWWGFVYLHDPSKFPSQDSEAASRQPHLMRAACDNISPIKEYLNDRATYIGSMNDLDTVAAWEREHLPALQRNPGCFELANDSDASFEPVDANLGPALETQLSDGTKLHNVYVQGRVRDRIMYSTYMFLSKP